MYMKKYDEQKQYFHFIARLRIFMIIIIIMLHCALPWTGTHWWPVISQNRTATLDGFMAVFSSCGVGLFFLISAFFHPAMLDRYGSLDFMKKRFVRLGVPLLIYLVCIVPIIMYAYYLNFRNYGYIPFWRYYFDVYWGFKHQPPNWTGPGWSDQQFLQLWFIQHLLIYGILYALWRLLIKRPKTPNTDTQHIDEPINPISAHLAIAAYVVALAAAYFLIRIRHPLFEWIGLFDAIQVEFAMLPQYISLFVIGLIAGRRNWFTRLPASVGYVWLYIGVTLSAFMYLNLLQKLIPFTLGGLSSNALAYAVLDALIGTGLSVGLITLFREKLNSRLSKFSRNLGRNVYCVFIIHVPLVILLHYCLYKSTLPPILLFVFTAAIAVPLSFAVSHYIVRRIPGADSIL